MRSKSLIFIVGGVAVAVIASAFAYWLLVVQPRVAPPVSVAVAPTAPAPAASSPAAAPTAAPSAAKPTAAAAPSPASTPAFDVVRVEPSGDTVVAGRAAPKAQVELRDDGKTIGAAGADANTGQFVILPPPLSPGRHPLRLSAQVDEGAPQVSDVVVVEIAGPAAAVAAAPAAKPSPAAAAPAPQPAVAAAATPSPAAPAATPSPAAATPAAKPAVAAAAAPTPTPAASAAAPAATPAAAPSSAPTATVAVAVASVRPIDPAGLEAVGSAPPGAHVRLRLNNSVLAEVIAGADGEWRLTIERGLTAGDYVLEAVVIDAAGAILARAEAPFVYPERETVASVAPAAAAAAPSPAAPSPAASPSASPAAALTLVASAPATPTPAAATPAAAAEPSSPPSPAASTAAAEPTPAASAPTASVAATPATPAPTASVAAPASAPAAAEAPVATASHAVVPEVRTYTVVHGDNLWDLAIKYYGDGLRYAEIYSANSSQIRDPNLIYIGQIFVVPPKPTTNPPPAR